MRFLCTYKVLLQSTVRSVIFLNNWTFPVTLKTWSCIFHSSWYPHVFLVISSFPRIFSHLITDTLQCPQGLWGNKQTWPLEDHVTVNFKRAKMKIQKRPGDIYLKVCFLLYSISMSAYSRIWSLSDSWPRRPSRLKNIRTSCCAW